MRYLIVVLVLIAGNLMLRAVSAQAAEEGPRSAEGLTYGSGGTYAEFHGFVNLEYHDFQRGGEGTPEGGAGVSSFDQHNFYFAAVARVRQNVTVFGELEYEHGGKEIKVDRAFLDLNVIKPYLNFRLGKIYAPFGLEIREYQAPVRRLVSRPLITDAFMFEEWTDVGANLYGEAPLGALGLTYDIALVNGPGAADPDADGIPNILQRNESAEALQTRDNNSNRTVVGRVSVPVRAVGFEVGGSYAAGRYSDAAATEDLDWSQYGLDADFHLAGLDLRGEYVARRADVPAANQAVLGGATFKGSGYYVQAAYRWRVDGPNLYYLEPVVRYDMLDPNRSLDDDELSQWAAGLNYAPWPHVVFRAEYQTTREAGPRVDNNGYLASAVVDF